MSKEVAKTEQPKEVVRTLTPQQQAIQNFKKQLQSYEKELLPKLLKSHNITPEQFVETVLMEIKKDDKLLQAFIENPASMYASIFAGAKIGLTPSGDTGEFYLIPRNVKQSNGQYKATVTPLVGYKGLVTILLRSGDITKIDAQIVYDGDEFEVTYGLEPKLHHKPNFDVKRTADKITFAYAWEKNKNGEFHFGVITRSEIEAIRDMGKYTNDLYFNDKMGINRWMEKKAALIQLSKLLPKDYYSNNAVSLISRLDGSTMFTLDNDNNVRVIENNTPTYQTKKSIYGSLQKPTENAVSEQTDEILPLLED